MTKPISSSPNPTFTEILLVRHGETSWNVEGRFQGHLDAELNEVGRQQAVVVADRLSREARISAIYSSDLKRAYDTASVIAAGFSGLEVKKDLKLRERHLGDLQGILLSEAAELKPRALDAYHSRDPSQEIPGGGESHNQVDVRCVLALERIAKKNRGERVIVVTHAGVIKSLYKKACPNGTGGLVLNTSINTILISDEDKWVVKSWGEIAHLGETNYLKSGFGGDNLSGWCP